MLQTFKDEHFFSHFHWLWFQTNWSCHFSPRYFNGVRIGTAFKCIFEETVPKLSVAFGNCNSLDSHKNQYPSPVLNFGFKEPQYSDKCESNLLLKCHIFTIGINIHKRYCYCTTSMIIRFMLLWVCMELVTTCRYHNMIKWQSSLQGMFVQGRRKVNRLHLKISS